MLDRNVLESKVAYILNQCLFKISHIGTFYLKDAIVYAYYNPMYRTSFNKYIYPKIAEKYHGGLKSIDRSIKTSIEYAYLQSKELMKDLLYIKEKPTPKTFVISIVVYLEEQELSDKRMEI